MIKESTTHLIEQARQWPTIVALDTNTVVANVAGVEKGRGLGGREKGRGE